MIFLPSMSASNLYTADCSSTGNVKVASIGMSSVFWYCNVELTCATNALIWTPMLMFFKGTESDKNQGFNICLDEFAFSNKHPFVN